MIGSLLGSDQMRGFYDFKFESQNTASVKMFEYRDGESDEETTLTLSRTLGA